jgi:hypothetical protein
VDHSTIYREDAFLTNSATDKPAVAKAEILCEWQVRKKRKKKREVRSFSKHKTKLHTFDEG